MSDKVDMIYDLVKSEKEESSDFRKEVRETHIAIEEKLNKIQLETTQRLSKIEALDEIQNLQLEEHMRRTDILENLHKDNEKRISTLEKPTTVLILLGKWMAWISGISAAIMMIWKLIELF
jgi:hypothetical protein